jgi:hypothetical protein
VAVVAAAAVRSTWSPCGLSMLSTITPVSERAKGNSYPRTVAWFVAGAVVGGATLGSAMAPLAGVLRALDPSETVVVTAAAGAALIAALSDSGVVGVRLPIHRRQVNERWLDQYRAWVYGAGFGWQIGCGVATYITTAAVYLVIVLGALTGEPVVALALGTAFGTLRGLAVLLTRHLDSPAALLAFHRRFTAAGPAAGRAAIVTELAACAALALASGAPVALGAAGVGVVGVAVVATRGRRALAR